MQVFYLVKPGHPLKTLSRLCILLIYQLSWLWQLFQIWIQQNISDQICQIHVHVYVLSGEKSLHWSYILNEISTLPYSSKWNWSSDVSLDVALYTFVLQGYAGSGKQTILRCILLTDVCTVWNIPQFNHILKKNKISNQMTFHKYCCLIRL